MFSISFVSRETGISAATLRKWEQRYGFPKPNRENGYTRTYSEEELTLLREVKRLLDQGAKPSALLSAEARHTVMLSVTHPSIVKNKHALFLDEALGLLVTHQIKNLRVLLEKQLKKIGIFAFIEEVAAPLTIAVGDNWANGTLSVFAEHCYSAQLYTLLTSVINTKPAPNDTPVILLATLSGEKHTLGLVMVQALLFEQGAYCINLGSELPLIEFPKAVSHYHANIVGLSFSIAFPKRIILSALVELRANLHPEISLWIGGTGVKQLDTMPVGVQEFTTATEVITAYTDYKHRFNTLKNTP
jgi:DNA-binding transcriptional MerR regulator/methylmalonyl-CoA mutase cobalamin-binding subunit